MALDEPLMGMFAGEWTARLLRRLGAKEADAIESGLIQRRIAQAQKRIASLVGEPKPADSAADWFKRNGLEIEKFSVSPTKVKSIRPPRQAVASECH
jgi:hypothetical protein